MTNAFLAALLKMAAEERLKAERERNLLFAEPCHVWELWFNRFGEARIKEYEVRAEVYEAFAHRLIADAASDLILTEFEKLTGPAELLGEYAPEPLFHFDGAWYGGHGPMHWRAMLPIELPPFNLIITGIN